MKIKKVLSIVFGLLLSITVSAQKINYDTLHICTEFYRPKINKAAGINNSMWKPGSVLKVKFLDGENIIQERVKNIARQWSNYSSIKFNFISSGPADIRISFLGNGSWSLVGNASTKYSVDLGTGEVIESGDGATLNFGWLEVNTPLEEYNRVVLHEFGHALGLIHEHQSPDAGISWNKPEVYAYYKSTQNWSAEDVDYNIFEKYTNETVSNSKYDKASIMHYAIPQYLVLDPSHAVGWNTNLSITDKSFIQYFYKIPVKGPNQSNKNGRISNGSKVSKKGK